MRTGEQQVIPVWRDFTLLEKHCTGRNSAAFAHNQHQQQHERSSIRPDEARYPAKGGGPGGVVVWSASRAGGALVQDKRAGARGWPGLRHGCTDYPSSPVCSEYGIVASLLYTALHCTVLYCTVLYCAMLCCYYSVLSPCPQHPIYLFCMFLHTVVEYMAGKYSIHITCMATPFTTQV